MKKIQIKPEQIKNAKGIKNPESLFSEKENLSKFDRDWGYKNTPEFDLEVNSYVSQIDYFDGQGDLKGDKFVIEHEGQSIVSDNLGGYGIWKNIKVDKYVGTLKFKGTLMPGNIVFYTNEESKPIPPEPEYMAIGGENVSFSGVDGHYMDVEGKFVIILDKKPDDFKITKKAAPTPPAPEPQLETGKMLAYKKDVKNKDNKTVIKGYLLYLPEDYYTSGKYYPLVIKFHGDGERGAVMDISNLPFVSDPERGITRGEKFDAVLICPQNMYTWDKENVKDADRMIEEAIKDLRIDRKRIYVTGLSKGGAATWDYLAQFPDKVAAAVPIAGWTSVSLEKAVNVPIWAFHNQGDKTVGVGGTINAINTLKGLGSKVAEMTIYNKSGHDAWTETYNNPKVWEWLFKQTK